ncbi:MAG TPA: carboxypeptidase regulatory-like domain-containing protein [Vicinamibacterales bacterium]|nr:carboxypeptidase regulatory-like domain-containing protein [Vicinamibacterales bacterium]
MSLKRQAMQIAIIGLAALVLGPAARPLLAQGTGQVDGVVRDEQGGVLPGAAVTLRNQDNGVTRTVTTESDGRYLFAALSPGRYQLRAELSGFAIEDVHDLVITIGLDIKHDFTLKIRAVAETVTVNAQSPVVDTTKAEVSGVVTRQQIEALPINSRQYLSLALLMPGTTVDATRSFFATVNAGGSMTFNGTGNIVDGTINNWVEDGEPRQDLPEDSVEEFKVTNSLPKAEFGLATGGVVQVVTKSGTNALHGDAFEYFRDKALNAKGVFESAKPAYRRNQFGGSVGGPVIHDKMHFYGSFERTAIDQFYSVNAPAAFYSAVDGTFLQPTTRNLYFGRGDWQIGNSQNLFARYLQEDELTTCVNCGGVTASTASFDQSVPRQSLAVGHTWLRGTRQMNEFRFQYAHAAFYGYPSGTSLFTDIGNFPAERTNRQTVTYQFPSLTYGSSYDDASPESRWEFKDTFTLNFSKHEVKFGGEYDNNHYRVDDAIGLLKGTFTFAQDQPFDPSNPATIAALKNPILFTATSAPVSTVDPSKYYVLFAQDDWKPAPHVTLNLGLRWEYLWGPSNEGLNPADFPVTLPYVDVAARGHRTNFGPRTGIAWDVTGDGRTVVRGGWGIYYGHIRTLAAIEEYRNFHRLSITINNPSYPDPYNGQNPANFIVSSNAPNITIAANNLRQPMAQQASAGISRNLGGDFAVHVDVLYNHTKYDYKTQNVNFASAATGLTVLGTPPLKAFGRIDQVQPASDLVNRQVYVKLEKRFSRRYQYMVSYSYTNSRDNAPMARFIDNFTSYDFGPSNGERRHAVVASGSFLFPWDITLGVVWTGRSPLPWSATAGRDLNRDGFNTDLVPGTTRNSGSRDLNLAAVNAWRAQNGLPAVSESQIDSSRINILDARVSKAFIFSGRKVELLAQGFNLLNTRNLQAQFGTGRIGNALSPIFGSIQSARPNFQGELAVRLTF